MRSPLDGYKAVELGTYHAGPAALGILGDLGLEIVKIEQPGAGDPLRARYKLGTASFELQKGKNLFFEGINRNKKSITLDLSKEKGREIAYKLIYGADIFLTNFRRPVVEKMRMDYQTLSRLNQRLIYITVSAFGPRGQIATEGDPIFKGRRGQGLCLAWGNLTCLPLSSTTG